MAEFQQNSPEKKSNLRGTPLMKLCSTEDCGLGKIAVTENRINELAY